MSQLNNISGVDLIKLEYEVFFQGDILEFDGPILSHYIDQRQKNYLMLSIGYDDKKNHSIWLLFKVGVTELSDYLKKKQTLLWLIHNIGEAATIVWSNSQGKHVRYRMININKLPEIYFPSDASYYDENIGCEYSLRLIEKLNKSITEKQKIIHTVKDLSYEHVDDDHVYHTVYNDLNVLKVRMLSSLLKPTFKDNGAKVVLGFDTIDFPRFSDLVDFATKMEQDPFGHIYDDLLSSTEKMLTLHKYKISKEKKYNDVVYVLTKYIGESIIEKNASKQREIYTQTYKSFLKFVVESDLDVDYFDITKNDKFKKLIEK